MKSIDSPFSSEGVRCAGTLLVPDTSGVPPVVIMAHGFGLIRAAGLMAFAERFLALGLAAFLFDYRSFGDSDGEPRHWVSPRRHLQDWKAALLHVRSLSEVDAERVVLWGTSFSGGHVLEIAASDSQVRAVIAQVPHVDGSASTSQTPALAKLRLGAAGVLDLVCGWFGRPVYRPIVGRRGELAAITGPEAWDGYMGIIPRDAGWENKTRAQIFIEMPFYSPIRHVQSIKAPTLIIAARSDTVTPANAARAAAERLPNGRFELLEGNHFEPYGGAVFEKNISLQIDFLREVKLSSGSQINGQ